MDAVSRVFGALALFGAALLAGCQATGSRGGFFDSPLQPGDEVEIEKPLPVPAELARVYLQHGTLTSYGGSNQYAPFCYFRVRDPLPEAQLIEPGVWVVQSVWMDETTVGLEYPLQVAGLWIMGGSGGVGRSPIAFQFHIRLSAPGRTPLLLVCSGAFDNPALARPIRLAEVREAFGEYVTVRVPEPPPGR